MSLLQQLKQPAVRDLYCACFGQDLMASGCNVASFDEVYRHFPHLSQWFIDLDNKPNDLLDHLSSLKSTRLGIYYEALWEYYLRNASVADLLAKNRQVRQDKQTIGEYDFIYYCRRRHCHIHLETAIKFYIGVSVNNDSQYSQQSSWIGPACRDRLDLKYTALVERQMRLSTTKEGKESLSGLRVERCDSELALKGMLFYPAYSTAVLSPVDSEKNHNRGIWLRQEELSIFLDQEKKCKWFILDRRQWCSPSQFDDKNALLTNEELESFFSSYFSDIDGGLCASPIQVAQISEGNVWQETQRYFVVGNDWNRVSA